MPKAKLTTKQAVDTLPNTQQGQTVYWCTDLRGFGVRVGARDKVFIVQRRVNGRDRRITLGRYGDVSLQSARQQAEQFSGEMSGGIDPVDRRRKATADDMTLREAWALYQQHLDAKDRSGHTRADYKAKIDCHLSDWLDRPLIAISRQDTNEKHRYIGKNSGRYAANGTMRVLRAIWRRARRQHPELCEPPTMNVDFYKEERRTAVVTEFAAWWEGVQKLSSPIRRDFYVWLCFTGCRAGETMTMRWDQIDLEKRIVRYPVTKTKAFEMPVSNFLLKLLQARRTCETTITIFGPDCPWVFPSATSVSGHLVEEKLNLTERKLFAEHWTPHTLRHTWTSVAENKVKIPDAHSRMLVNHKVRFAINGDVHMGYNHPDLDDLRESQQRMTDYLLEQIKPKPSKGKKRSNVVEFRKSSKAA